MRIAPAAALLALVLACAGCGEGGDDASPPPVTTTGRTTSAATVEEPARLAVEEVVSGLESPLHVAVVPGEPDRLYVVEQAGRIVVLEGGSVRAEPFLDIRNQVQSGGERGLLSVAFHPDYAENGRLYVDYTNLDGDTRVVEYRANDDRTGVDPGSARVLLAVDQPYANHNGGLVRFGPDGLLYVGMGDGGSGGDPENRAQNLRDRLGKLLRRDVDDPGADWEIAAYGLRNPWRYTFDPESGDLYLADVGQSAREEVDYAPWPLDGLLNFGWDVFEGDLPYEEKQPNGEGRLVAPIAVYGRDGGCSVTGGEVYRGSAIPGLAGRYFHGDFCSGKVWSLRVRDGRARARRTEAFTVESLASFGVAADGELLLVSLGGTVYRLVAGGGR